MGRFVDRKSKLPVRLYCESQGKGVMIMALVLQIKLSVEDTRKLQMLCNYKKQAKFVKNLIRSEFVKQFCGSGANPEETAREILAMPPRPASAPSSPDDERVRKAIEKAVEFGMKSAKTNGGWIPDAEFDVHFGLDRVPSTPTPNFVSEATTHLFWDCECVDNFHHTKSEEKCDECGCFPEDQPDSIVSEVLEHAVKWLDCVNDMESTLIKANLIFPESDNENASTV
jgi:hypothetical protein